MKTRKSIVWTGAALLIAAIFVAVISARQDKIAVPAPAAEPNLFPFIKPQDGAVPDSHGKSTETAQPPVSRETSLTPTNIATVQAWAQKMRAQGASEDEIYRMRAAALGPETAARLAQIDSSETAWKTRVDAYLAERTRLIESAANFPGTDQAQVLQLLRDTRFTSEEQNLLASYESSGSPQLIQ